MGWFRGTQQDDGREDVPSFEERLARIHPGVPGRCPECDGLGYIDSIDIGHRYQIQHCKDCLHRWEYLFDPDGAVVGLTQLDPSGKPVARSRVRPLRAAPAPAAPEPQSKLVAQPADEDEVVLDLRDGAPADLGDRATGGADAVAVADAEHLSPAEWLRRSLHRS